jgi:hypothetical protein
MVDVAAELETVRTSNVGVYRRDLNHLRVQVHLHPEQDLVSASFQVVSLPQGSASVPVPSSA